MTDYEPLNITSTYIQFLLVTDVDYKIKDDSPPGNTSF